MPSPLTPNHHVHTPHNLSIRYTKQCINLIRLIITFMTVIPILILVQGRQIVHACSQSSVSEIMNLICISPIVNHFSEIGFHYKSAKINQPYGVILFVFKLQDSSAAVGHHAAKKIRKKRTLVANENYLGLKERVGKGFQRQCQTIHMDRRTNKLPHARIAGKYYTCSTWLVIVIYCYRSIPGSYKQGRHKQEQQCQGFAQMLEAKVLSIGVQVSRPCQVFVTQQIVMCPKLLAKKIQAWPYINLALCLKQA